MNQKIHSAIVLSALVFLGFEAQAEEPQGMPKSIKVTEHHKVLHHCAGTWDVAQKMFMGDQVMEATAVQECRIVLGGLGVAYDYKTTDKDAFVGHGMTTWNPSRKKFESYWSDNLSWGGGTHGVGIYDAKKKVMTEYLVTRQPDGSKQKYRSVTQFVSNDKQITTFYTERGGKEVKMMEFVYTRKASSS